MHMRYALRKAQPIIVVFIDRVYSFLNSARYHKWINMRGEKRK